MQRLETGISNEGKFNPTMQGMCRVVAFKSIIRVSGLSDLKSTDLEICTFVEFQLLLGNSR